MTNHAIPEADTPLEQAYALLARAIDDQGPGNESRYLARLALLLLDELRYSERALQLIDSARVGPPPVSVQSARS